MNKFTSAVKAFLADEDGITTIEYALLACLIGVALATVTSGFGTSMSTAFNTIGNKITTKATSSNW